LLLAIGCHDGGPPRPTDPATLTTTLEDLAVFGDKHVGTDAGRRAGDYVLGRMRAIGLRDVHTESFAFPRHQVDSAGVTATVDGAELTIGFDVLEGSGAGHAEGDVVHVGHARPEELAGVDVRGKIALVDRDRSYHRAAQYANVTAAGALAMIYVSTAPQNLRQVGSVRFDGWSPLGAIPVVSLGADDGARLASGAAQAVIDVQARPVAATGSNLIARIPGSDARGMIVLGAHYDTWFTGSSDNGGGVAALLALAQRRMARPQPRYTLVFVAYDGEEVALYGGYHYLRQHRIIGHEPILVALNFEVPSAKNSTLLGLARSNHDALDRALLAANLGFDYPIYASMEMVPILFGGIIPTDIQGIYRNGVPTASTAVDSPWYHTVEDTPDKVDTTMLAQAVDDFDAALTLLMKDEPSQFAALDPMLWQATVTAAPRASGDPLDVDVAVSDANGVPQPGAMVQATLMVDDFFVAARDACSSDDGGRAHFRFSAAAAAMGSGRRFVHVTAGPNFPYVEQLMVVE
jgi:aminopeptidase YwaD